MKYTCVGISKSPRLSSLSGPADAGYPARWSCDHRVFFRLRLSSSLWLGPVNWAEDIRERVDWSFIDPGHKRKIVAPDASRWQSHFVGWQLAGALAGLLLSAMSGKLAGLLLDGLRLNGVTRERRDENWRGSPAVIQCPTTRATASLPRPGTRQWMAPSPR